MNKILVTVVALVGLSLFACASKDATPAQKEGTTEYSVPADKAQEMVSFYNDPSQSGCYRLPCSVSAPDANGNVTLTIPACDPSVSQECMDCLGSGKTSTQCATVCSGSGM
jgi:hypothetical protein